jgi:hypothetical protein
MQFFVYFTMEKGQKMGRKTPPSPEWMAEVGRFHKEGMESGVIVASGRLGQDVTRVRRDGEELAITEGPFIEGKELIPGFTIINVDTKEQATQWVADYRDMMGMPELRMSEIKH